MSRNQAMLPISLTSCRPQVVRKPAPNRTKHITTKRRSADRDVGQAGNWILAPERSGSMRQVNEFDFSALFDYSAPAPRQAGLLPSLLTILTCICLLQSC